MKKIRILLYSCKLTLEFLRYIITLKMRSGSHNRNSLRPTFWNTFLGFSDSGNQECAIIRDHLMIIHPSPFLTPLHLGIRTSFSSCKKSPPFSSMSSLINPLIPRNCESFTRKLSKSDTLRQIIKSSYICLFLADKQKELHVRSHP